MPASSTRSTRHALVVDDNADSATTLGMLLEMEGFTVSTAGSLEEARRCVASQSPRVVFLDLGLPDGNGLDLLEQTRDLPGTAVVVLSGTADPDVSRDAMRRGAIGYVVKPASMQQLQKLLLSVHP